MNWEKTGSDQRPDADLDLLAQPAIRASPEKNFSFSGANPPRRLYLKM